ncbi:hypothetical protein NMG60_11016274 [Bertholletia excelsa]
MVIISLSITTKKMCTVLLANQGIVSVGPWGGEGGNSFTEVPESGYGLSGMTIGYTDVLRSLIFHYTNADGESYDSVKYGTNGAVIKQVLFKYPEEYITSITITYGLHKNYTSTPLISRLAFKTTSDDYGPFGPLLPPDSDTTVTIPIERGRVVGFFGRAGDCIDALGIHIKPT